MNIIWHSNTDQHAVGFWSGEKHILIKTYVDEAQENQSILEISNFDRDATAEVKLPPVTVSTIYGSITVAQGGDLNMVVWEQSDPTNNTMGLSALLIDQFGNVVNQIQIPDVRYRLTNFN